jgi:hypothetical protein
MCGVPGHPFPRLPNAAASPATRLPWPGRPTPATTPAHTGPALTRRHGDGQGREGEHLQQVVHDSKGGVARGPQVVH